MEKNIMGWEGINTVKVSGGVDRDHEPVDRAVDRTRAY